MITKNNSNKLAFDGWFRYYKGLIYCNKVTSINQAIMNKLSIDSAAESEGKNITQAAK